MGHFSRDSSFFRFWFFGSGKIPQGLVRFSHSGKPNPQLLIINNFGSNIKIVPNSVLFCFITLCKSQALPMLEFLKLPTSSSSFSEFVAQEMEEKVIWAVYPWNTCPWTKFNRKSHSLRSLRNLTPFGCKRASSRISSHPWWVSGE